MTRHEKTLIRKMIQDWQTIGGKLFGFSQSDMEQFVRVVKPFEDDGIILHEPSEYWLLTYTLPDAERLGMNEDKRRDLIWQLMQAIDEEVLRRGYADPRFDWTAAKIRIESRVTGFQSFVEQMNIPN